MAYIELNSEMLEYFLALVQEDISLAGRTERARQGERLLLDGMDRIARERAAPLIFYVEPHPTEEKYIWTVGQVNNPVQFDTKIGSEITLGLHGILLAVEGNGESVCLDALDPWPLEDKEAKKSIDWSRTISRGKETLIKNSGIMSAARVKVSNDNTIRFQPKSRDPIIKLRSF